MGVAKQLPTGARILMAQPPGRDVRADEPNCLVFEELVTNYSNAIAEVLGLDLDDNQTFSSNIIVCGDSLGSITCWSVVHDLRRRYDHFRPFHMFVSGNPSPEVSSKQYGLGTHAHQSIYDETDEDLLSFLKMGHVGFREESNV